MGAKRYTLTAQVRSHRPARVRVSSSMTTKKWSSDARWRDRRSEVQRIELRRVEGEPLDDVPLKLPAGSRRNWQDGAALAPKIGQPTALASHDAHHERQPRSSGAGFAAAWALVLVARWLVRVGNRPRFAMCAATAWSIPGGQRGQVLVFVGLGAHRGQQLPRRFHVVLASPGQFLARRITAAVIPTLLGRQASAGVMLARKGPVRRFTDQRRQRQPDRGHDIRAQANDRHQPSAPKRTTSMPTQESHALIQAANAQSKSLANTPRS
jgi:hypothetical protein